MLSLIADPHHGASDWNSPTSTALSAFNEKSAPTSGATHGCDGPPGWDVCIHPRGWKYFHHPQRKIVTDNIEELQNTWDVFPESDPSDNYEQAFISTIVTGKRQYIFVNHVLRYASRSRDEVTHKSDEYERDYDLRIEYWNFMCQYPAHRPLPPGSFEAARQMLNFYTIDGLRHRSEASTPLTLEQNKELLAYLDSYSKSEAQTVNMPPPGFKLPSQSVAMTALVSWILMISARHCKLHQYGQHTKQESPGSSHSFTETNSLWFTFLSPFICFGAPRGHLERIATALKTMELRRRVDSWVEYLDAVGRELELVTFAATVLLSSSIGLLSAPGIDSATRIVTLLSVAFTLGCIITGIYLQWQTGKIKFNDSEMRLSSKGPILAIIFSVPVALLTWAMIFFVTAIILYSILGFQLTSSGAYVRFSRPTSTVVLVASSIFLVLMGITVIFFRRMHSRHRQLIPLEVDPV